MAESALEKDANAAGQNEAKPPKGGWQLLDKFGETWEWREPKPIAAVFLSSASSPQLSGPARIGAVLQFLQHVLSTPSFLKAQELAFDHESDFSMDDLSELMTIIATAEADERPTVPSSPSARTSRAGGARSGRGSSSRATATR